MLRLPPASLRGRYHLLAFAAVLAIDGNAERPVSNCRLSPAGLNNEERLTAAAFADDTVMNLPSVFDPTRA